jgi:hypothetical protein
MNRRMIAGFLLLDLLAAGLLVAWAASAPQRQPRQLGATTITSAGLLRIELYDDSVADTLRQLAQIKRDNPRADVFQVRIIRKATLDGAARWQRDLTIEEFYQAIAGRPRRNAKERQ